MVWYSHLLKNFPQFVVKHTVKGFGIVNKAEIDGFLELYCFFDDLMERQWQPTPILLPGKSHGWRNLIGCSTWGLEELHTTEWLHFHFSLPCIGERNGNPLQCSCLENPSDGRAWWAVVYGVAQSWTRLKWLSSSSSNGCWEFDLCFLWHFYIQLEPLVVLLELWV